MNYTTTTTELHTKDSLAKVQVEPDKITNIPVFFLNKDDEKDKIGQIETPPWITTPLSSEFNFYLEKLEFPLFENIQHKPLTRGDEYSLFTSIILLRGAIRYFGFPKALPSKILLVDEEYWEHNSPIFSHKSPKTSFKEDIIDIYDRVHNILLQYNEGLVKSVVYKSNSPITEDQLQEGRMGVLRAIQDFNPYRGNKFSTYATWWIRQRVGVEKKNDRTIHLPSEVCDNLSTYNKLRETLYQKYGREPILEEVFECANRKKIDIGEKECLRDTLATLKMRSLDSLISNEEKGGSWYSILTSNSNIEQLALSSVWVSNIIQIATQLCKDSPSLRINHLNIFFDRFGLLDERPMTLDEVGEKHNISRETVRKISDNLLRRIRWRLETSNTKD